MTARSKRQKAQKKRRQRNRATTRPFDIHVRQLTNSVGSLESLANKFAAMDEPAAAMDKEFGMAVVDFVDSLKHFEPHRLIETARMAYLPWAHANEMVPTSEATAAHVELLALIALAAAQEHPTEDAYPTLEVQEISHFVTKASERLNTLLELSQLRATAASDPNNRLAMIDLLLRGSQVLVRHTSYPEMVEETLSQLFGGNEKVHATLTEDLGFNAKDAIAVLNACHSMQETQLNSRGEAFADAMNLLMASQQEPASADREAGREAIRNLFEPDVDASTVSLDDVASLSGLTKEQVAAVIEQFRLDLTSLNPADAVEAFTSGNNPLRTHPLIVTKDGRLMLPHNALIADAVKENLEEHLKSASVWNDYVKHRGDLLEARTHTALERVLPGAVHRDGFEYYVPVNDAELTSGNPARYTKRVEGDHLIVIDDVAFIVEDKAVALSALSRGGKTNRLRTDLTGIITKAADQATRLREVIERDGGVRVEDEGWVDLSMIREIHTIAVSLDDLTSITTATAELVRAGLLDYNNIPWTVSLHDLELITKLINRPAEFLLYLRRRLTPNATVMFSAADELDFFLYFFEAGLWVEPDPDQVRAFFNWMNPPTTGERKRFRKQIPAYLTSRTDALDAWFQAKRSPDGRPAPKPAMTASPLDDLIDEIQTRKDFGWLSIGATLLGPATATQHKMARIPKDLLKAPAGNGLGRSLALPMVHSIVRAEAWLLVWGTRPVAQDPIQDEKNWREYLQAKKHQLGIPRGAALVYDEGTQSLVDVYYDGNTGELPSELSGKLAALRPPTSFTGWLHPNAKRPPKPIQKAHA